MSSYHASGPCHRCGRAGHLARECSLHICFRCNGRGHMAWECVEGVTCSRCGEKGHLQRNCKNVSCHKCGRKGHISKFCNDPFIKAEEVERHERQQALLESRSGSGQVNDKGGLGSQSRSVATATGSQRAAPGPWDGLGDPGQDRTLSETHTSSGGVAIGKRGTNRSEGAMVGNVRILSVKRKIYPKPNMERMKRPVRQNCGNQDADMCGDAAGIPACKDTSNTSKDEEEPPQWNSLLGYGSGDSRDDSCTSSDGDSEVKDCKFEEHVHLKLKTCVDEVNGSAIALQSSVEQEPVRETTFVGEEIVERGSLRESNISTELV